jgi:hypothetical protein
MRNENVFMSRKQQYGSLPTGAHAPRVPRPGDEKRAEKRAAKMEKHLAARWDNKRLRNSKAKRGSF